MSIARDAARNEVKVLASQRRLSSIMATFVLPGALTIWVGVGALPSIGALKWWFWLGGAGLLGLWVVFGAFSLRSRFLATELYFELADVEDKVKEETHRIKNLEENIIYLSTATQATLGWFEMVAVEVRSPGATLEEIVDDIVYPIAVNGSAFFGFEADEHWTISVYRYDDVDHMLRPVSRMKDQWNPSGDRQAREWPPGVGHIGQAFSTKRPIITGDATAPDVAVFVQAPENLRRDGDDSQYVSFASIPIGPLGEGEDPLGVVVATSSRRGRFDEGNALILEQAASALACVMETRHISRVNRDDGGPA